MDWFERQFRKQNWKPLLIDWRHWNVTIFMFQMIVFSFSAPVFCLFFLVLVNAWLTNPCLVIVFRAEFLSDVSCPWCSLYLVDRSSIFLWPLHAVPCWQGIWLLRSKETVNWQIDFPFPVCLDLTTFPKYFFVAGPWAPWFSRCCVDNGKHLGPSQFYFSDPCLFPPWNLNLTCSKW